MVRKRNANAGEWYLPHHFSFHNSLRYSKLYKHIQAVFNIDRNRLYQAKGTRITKATGISLPNVIQFSKFLINFIPNAFPCNFAAHRKYVTTEKFYLQSFEKRFDIFVGGGAVLLIPDSEL